MYRGGLGVQSHVFARLASASQSQCRFVFSVRFSGLVGVLHLLAGLPNRVTPDVRAAIRCQKAHRACRSRGFLLLRWLRTVVRQGPHHV